MIAASQRVRVSYVIASLPIVAGLLVGLLPGLQAHADGFFTVTTLAITALGGTVAGLTWRRQGEAKAANHPPAAEE